MNRRTCDLPKDLPTSVLESDHCFEARKNKGFGTPLDPPVILFNELVLPKTNCKVLSVLNHRSLRVLIPSSTKAWGLSSSLKICPSYVVLEGNYIQI
jgi:hypothetical protein